MAKSKRWYRPRNLILVVLAILIVSATFATVRMATATPGRAVDYWGEFMAVVEGHQPADAGPENAFDALLECIAILDEVEEEIREEAKLAGEDGSEYEGRHGWPVDYSALGDEELPEPVRRWTLEAMRRLEERGLYGRLDEVAARPRAVRQVGVEDDFLFTLLLPELGRTRQLARLERARMDLARAAGDWRTFVSAFEQALALGRVCSQQGTLIDRLVGVAIFALATEAAQTMIAETPTVEPSAGRAMLAALERQTGPVPPIERQFMVERLFLMDAVQRLHTDDGRGSGVLLVSELARFDGEYGFGAAAAGSAGGLVGEWRAFNVLGLLFPRKAETVARADEYFDGVIGLSRLPAAQRTADVFDGNAYLDSLPMGYVLLRIFVPATDRAMGSADSAEAALAQLRLTLAAEVFRAEQGRLPTSLDELVPSLLADAPLDPDTGTPFRYRPVRTGEPAVTDRGYVIEGGEARESGAGR